MQVLHFNNGHLPELAGVSQSPDDEGFYWVDAERSESDWQGQIQHWLGSSLHYNHVRDCLNEVHPPFYDGSDDYDLLIVHSASLKTDTEALRTSPVVFIVSPRAVVTLRAADDQQFSWVHKRFLASPHKVPDSVGSLLFILIVEIANGLIERRNGVTELLSIWQDRLLDQRHVFSDWQALFKLRGQLRRLEIVAESQLDALVSWQEATSMTLDRSFSIRFNDLKDHFRRVYNHTLVTQNDIDTLMQAYFSINTQRTNEVLKFLAIVSALFLPLNLLAGIFGMNFVYMPFLKSEFGPWVVAGVMVTLCVGLLYGFRRLRWI